MAGEDPEGAMHRCEGEKGCQRWAAQKGDTYEEKSRACPGCPKNCLPPLREEEQADSREALQLARQVRYLVRWENAGRDTDWSEYPFEIEQLFVYWRRMESEVRQIREFRHASYIKGLMSGPAMPFTPPAP